MEKVKLKDGTSADMVIENIKKLKTIFPEAFTEYGVNFETLRQLLGDAGVLDEGEEKYGLNWHGKKKARQIALTPSTGTLLPCPEESVDWDKTQNLFIEGDNLEVLKLLQKSYANKVKMVYIDPPYNTGNEFIYPDRFQDNLNTYLKYTGQVDGEGMKFSSNTEQNGRFHTNWLNMMYPRLKLAKNILSQDGVIFISIDNTELSNLKAVCDEIFGINNFVACFVWEKRTNRENRKMISSRSDYLLCYCKDMSQKDSAIKKLPMSEEALSRYSNPDNDPRGPWKSDPATAQAGHGTKSQFYVFKAPSGKEHHLESGRCWLYTKEVMQEAVRDGRIWLGKDGNNVPRVKTYLEEKERGLVPETIWFAKDASTNEAAKTYIKDLFDGKAVFETPKPVELIRMAMDIGAGDGIVLDFFAGTCVTAEAAMKSECNNRFIMVQLPEICDSSSEAFKAGFSTVAEIGKERIRRVANKIKEKNEKAKSDLGFKVFKLANSNIKVWNPDGDDLEQTMFDHKEHLIKGRKEQDVLYELLLKRGVDLTVPIENMTISGKTVYSIGYGVLFACLDETITREDVEALGQGIIDRFNELKPSSETHVILRDSAFTDDVAKTNLAAILEQNGITHVRSL